MYRLAKNAQRHRDGQTDDSMMCGVRSANKIRQMFNEMQSLMSTYDLTAIYKSVIILLQMTQCNKYTRKSLTDK